MWIRTEKWRRKRPPPDHIFQKAQATVRLSAHFFYLDKFLQNFLSNDKKFCRNLLNKDGGFNRKSALLSKFVQKRKNIFIFAGKWYSPRAPPVSDVCSSQMPETEENMYKRYYRMDNPECKPDEIKWIEMTGSEFYRFVNSPEGQGRYFIDMGDVVLESSKREAQIHRAEKDHSDYLKEQEEGWSTVSLYTIEDESGCSGEEVARDETQDVETAAMLRIETAALRQALKCLDSENYRLIYALYLADKRYTERELAHKLGVSQNAINKQKKKTLQKLKILVVKIQKSSQ